MALATIETQEFRFLVNSSNSSVTLVDNLSELNYFDAGVRITSTGSSGTADFIDYYQSLQKAKIREWKSIPVAQEYEEVEEDLFIFFPPKEQYEIVLDVEFTGRAKPLIYIEED